VAAFAREHASEVDYPRGSFFTRTDQRDAPIGFVIRGLFRVYYSGADGTYHVRNFIAEGRPLGSYATAISNEPAHVDIEALEDSRVLQFSFEALRAQFARSQAWER